MEFGGTAVDAYSLSPSGALHCDFIDEIKSYGFRCLTGVIESALGGAITLLGVSLLAMIVWGGVKYLTAGGDEKALATARKTLTYAALGFFGAVASYFLLQVLGQRLKFDLFKFDLPCPPLPPGVACP